MHYVWNLFQAHLETSIGVLGVLVASFYAWRHIRDLKSEKRGLEADKQQLEGEISTLKNEWAAERQKLKKNIDELRDTRGAVFARGVGDWMHDQIKAGPSICQQLLLLAAATSFKDATKRLETVERSIADWGEILPSCANVARILETLGSAAKVDPESLKGGLWSWQLEKSPGRSDDDEHELLVSTAVRAYAALVAHLLPDKKEDAIAFCEDSCTNENPVLQGEAACVLLPGLLSRFPNEDAVLRTYQWLFGVGTADITAEERENLLIKVFHGLKSKADITSQVVSDIWAEAFKAGTKRDSRLDEPRPTAFTNWKLAVRDRLDAFRRSYDSGTLGGLEKEELVNLRVNIAEYVQDDNAPTHEDVYSELARISHEALDYLVPEAKRKPFRPIARAIVRQANIKIVIAPLAEGANPVEATLINFSLEDGPHHKRGVWAESSYKPTWAPGGSKVPVESVVKVIRPGRAGEAIEFRNAIVLETQDVPRGTCGFRIQLGKAEERGGKPDYVGFLEDIHKNSKFPRR